MKLLATLIIVIATSLAPTLSRAGEISLTSDARLCGSDIPEDKAALLRAKRSGKIVFLDVTAELNCANVPDKPELREWRDAATVILATKSPSGAAALCLCAHKLSFEITDLDKGVTIYYTQDGTVLGHVDAP